MSASGLLWWLTALATAALSAGATCPEEWLEFEEGCYWASDFVVPWRSAAAACRLADAQSQPASVHSQFENAAIDSLLNGEKAWIGLSRNSSTAGFSWSDESPVDFTYWNTHEPRNGDCAVINGNVVTGQWATADCDQAHLFVCKTDSSKICPQGWTKLDNTCYIASNATSYGSKSSQESICSALHSDATPVVIHSAGVNQLLYSIIEASTWIGLFRTTSGGSYHWADGSGTNYTNWYSTPDYYSKYYVYMSSSSGEWHTYDYSYYMPVFCQIAFAR